MKESFPGRREVAAEQYEESAEFKARERLTEIGVFKKISDLDLYHGRAGDGKAWEVQPDFNNSGDATGNLNINKKPALNTGSYETAKEFSKARVRREGGVAEVHKIESLDPDAMIIDLAALNHLSEEEANETNRLLRTISMGPITGAPLNFDDRNALDKASGPNDFVNGRGLMFSDEVDAVAQKTGIKRSVAEHVGSAINTCRLIGCGRLGDVCRKFSDDKSSLQLKFSDGKSHDIPLNHEYFANWLRTNHIVGCKMSVISATLGKTIDNYLLFDLEKVNTVEKNEKLIAERNRRFGRVARAMNEKLKDRRTEVVKILTENLYAKPEEIVEAAKKTPGFEKTFDEDAGNKEGYKLGEHTETVLRIFDDNYADLLPADALPIMRLALLVHDIGKGEAAKRNDKQDQDWYNINYAEKFMSQNGIDEKTRGLVEAMIGQGKSLMSKYLLSSNKGRKEELGKQIDQLSAFCLKQYLDIEPTAETISSLDTMLSVLQTCDSAAYTTMSVTRAKKKNGIISYWNYKSFNNSFRPFHGFTGRRVRMK